MMYNLVFSIFFRLINFGVLIGFIFYVYKKYLYQQVVEGVAQQDTLIDALHQEIDSLERHDANLQQMTQEQRAQYVQLEERIRTWTEAVEQQVNIRLFEKNDRIGKLKQRSIDRAHYIERQLIAKKVLAATLEKTENIIHQRMVGRAGSQYVERIITHIKLRENNEGAHTNE